MSVNRTKIKYRLFNRLRAREGFGEELELITYLPSTGYNSAAIISVGWSGKKIEDGTQGGEVFEVKVADIDDEFGVLFADRPSHIKIDDYYYKVSGVDSPKHGPRVWTIRCAPTGEKTI